MLYPSLAELLKNISSRYLLVNIIAKRAREIAMQGEEYDEKPVSSAINEIADGHIRVNFDS